jgi:hypothetical protein
MASAEIVDVPRLRKAVREGTLGSRDLWLAYNLEQWFRLFSVQVK